MINTTNGMDTAKEVPDQKGGFAGSQEAFQMGKATT